jgi:hypothetical protein
LNGHRCYICNLSNATGENVLIDGVFWYLRACPTCGVWHAPDSVTSHLESPDNRELMWALAAHIRQANERGERTVELTVENWRGFAEQHRRTPFARRQDMLMRWFDRNSNHAGMFVDLGDHQTLFPLVDAKNRDEVQFLAETLWKQELLERHPESSLRYRIAAKGWDHLFPVASGGVPGTCFVAMSFDESLDPAFDLGIFKAVEDCGYHADRVDRRAHNDEITDRIIAGIRAAQFVVADFTLHRQAVYYEAGFAQGLGRTVIRTCQDTNFKDLNFDTRQYVHLKWSTPADLRTTLADHILATVGRWGAAR